MVCVLLPEILKARKGGGVEHSLLLLAVPVPLLRMLSLVLWPWSLQRAYIQRAELLTQGVQIPALCIHAPPQGQVWMQVVDKVTGAL